MYRTLDSDTQGTAASWHEFGAGLPNAPVTDIEFDPTDNRLIVSTLGRGAWTPNPKKERNASWRIIAGTVSVK